MKVRFKIRMAWTFDGCEDDHGRYPIAEALRAAGIGKEAIAKMYATPLMHLAEVEIDESGTMKVVSIRPIEQCRSVHKSGDKCYKREEHGREHESRTAIPGGMTVRFWKDSVYAGGARPDPGRCWTREADRLYLVACWERAGRPSPSRTKEGIDLRQVANDLAGALEAFGAQEQPIRADLAASYARRLRAAIGATSQGADRHTLPRPCPGHVVPGDPGHAARCNVCAWAGAIGPCLRDASAPADASLGKCPGATTDGSQRCTREQGHPGRCFDGKRTFADGDPPVTHEASYAEARDAQKFKE